MGLVQKSEFFSRRMGATNAIVAIGTRWHENDLFGKLLDQNIPGEHWTHLRFPAIDEEGNALCPDLIPLKELEISRLTDPREWQALYMGDPTPDTRGCTSSASGFNVAFLQPPRP